MTWDRFEHTRRLIPERADWHLDNWARWMRRYRVGKGYPDRSVGLSTGGFSGDAAFDDLCHEADMQAARTADAVLDGLSPQRQAAIHNVYLAAVWRFRGDPLQVFVEAAAEFWKHAKRKGLT